MYEISGKVALVTGGTSGIGLSIVEGLLDNGLKAVAIVARNETKGKSVVERIQNQYGDQKAIFIRADTFDRDQFENAFKTTVDTFKNLDIVVNNAGEAVEKEWEREVATNLIGTTTGTILAVDKYLPRYKTGDEAVVLNVSSIIGLDAAASVPVYSATKSGIIGLSRSFGADVYYQKSKVRVMVVCPGFTETPMFHYSSSVFLNDSYMKILESEIENVVVQDTGAVTKIAMHMIKHGRSGCVWAVENNQPPYEVGVNGQRT